MVLRLLWLLPFLFRTENGGGRKIVRNRFFNFPFLQLQGNRSWVPRTLTAKKLQKRKIRKSNWVPPLKGQTHHGVTRIMHRTDCCPQALVGYLVWWDSFLLHILLLGLETYSHPDKIWKRGVHLKFRRPTPY